MNSIKIGDRVRWRDTAPDSEVKKGTYLGATKNGGAVVEDEAGDRLEIRSYELLDLQQGDVVEWTTKVHPGVVFRGVYVRPSRNKHISSSLVDVGTHQAVYVQTHRLKVAS